MEMKENIINEIVDEIYDITEMFYQQRIPDALDKTNLLLNHIVSIVEVIMKLEYNNGARLVGTFGEVLNAMEVKDYILMSDILRDDMTVILEEYKDILK